MAGFDFFDNLWFPTPLEERKAMASKFVKSKVLPGGWLMLVTPPKEDENTYINHEYRYVYVSEKGCTFNNIKNALLTLCNAADDRLASASLS